MDKNKELGFTLKKRQSRRHPAETITDIDYADDLIKYCLVMADSNIHYVTATYIIKDILNFYESINQSKIDDKYLEIFM